MPINPDRMAEDIERWKKQEKAKVATSLLNKHVDVAATGITVSYQACRSGETVYSWSVDGAVAYARAMMRPGLEDSGYAPSKALAFLQAVVSVPNPQATLEALQWEKGVMRQERRSHRGAMERSTVAAGYRDIRRGS